MQQTLIQGLALTALVASASIASAQQTISLGVPTEGAVQGPKTEYRVSLANVALNISDVTSNQNFEVSTSLNKWDDVVYDYTGLYASMDYDEDGTSYVRGYYIKAPAMNMTIDKDTKELVFGWTGIDNKDYLDDLSYWQQHMSQVMEGGSFRLTIPEGLVTLTDVAGFKYNNAAATIIYQVVGNYGIVTIESIEPSTKNSLTELSEIKMHLAIDGASAEPTQLATDFMTSEFSLTYTAPGETKGTKDYTRKNFVYDPDTQVLSLTFGQPGDEVKFTDYGTYTFSGNTGSIALADSDGNRVTSNASFSYTWTVEKPTAPFSSFEPAEGTLNLDINDQGIASVLFRFSGAVGEPNTAEELYAQLYRDGQLIAQVPTTNFKLITYDGFYADVWCIAFWEKPNGRAKLPGDYTVVIPEGMFLVNGVPSRAKTAHYTIVGKDYVVSPTAGDVQFFKDVTFTWPLATGIELDLSDPDAQPYFYNFSADDASDIQYELNINGNSITFSPTENVTAAGRWEVGFAPNVVVLTYGEGEEAVTKTVDTDSYVTYNIASEDKVVPTLNMDATVDALPGVINFLMPEDEILSVVNSAAPSYIYPVNADGTFGDYVARMQASKQQDGKSFDLTNILGKNIVMNLNDGRYAIELGARLFNTKSDNTFSAAMTYYFTIERNEQPYTTTLYNGQSVREFTSIEFTFNEPVTIASTQPAFFTDGVTSYLAAASMKEGDDKTVIYTAAVPVTIPGKYTLKGPNGAVKAVNANENGLVNYYDVRADIHVVGAEGQLYIPKPSISPDYLVDHVSAITLTYPVEGKINSDLTPMLYLVTDTDPILACCYDMNTVSGNVVTINSEAETAFQYGKYQLVIPEGFYFTDDAISEEAVFDFDLTDDAVDMLLDNDHLVTVYTLTGLCVMRDADPAALQQLPNGLYIINGKKVILRR